MRKVKLITACLSLVLILGGIVLSIIYFSNKRNDAKVITTVFPIYDICRELLGDEEDVKMLLDSGADLHSYEPNAQDIATLSKCELFIYIGGVSDERWVGGVIQSVKNVNMNTLSLMDCVEGVETNEDDIIEEDEHHHHEHEEESDEHIWLSIKNMLKMTDAIKDKLIDVFPEKTAIIEINYEKYINELNILDSEYSKVCQNSDKTIIVADRFPFVYLTNDYSIKYKALFSTCSTETEASTEAIAEMINQVNSANANYVIILENSSVDVASSIIRGCENTSIEILRLNSCQSIVASQISDMSYISIMKDNLEIFKKVLG
ncbi:MAG: zinc ABC transporter substrate-binding protein [Clostridia bacterium]|nr:zinc ABC transporter substrate-binding protein [Clostridia bacterium]